MLSVLEYINQKTKIQLKRQITRRKTCRNVQGEINWIEEWHKNTQNESARNETNVTS